MLCSDSSVVEGFEFGGWDAAEFAVQSTLVEPVDVAEGGQLDVFGVALWALALAVRGLRWRVHHVVGTVVQLWFLAIGLWLLRRGTHVFGTR